MSLVAVSAQVELPPRQDDLPEDVRQLMWAARRHKVSKWALGLCYSWWLGARPCKARGTYPVKGGAVPGATGRVLTKR